MKIQELLGNDNNAVVMVSLADLRELFAEWSAAHVDNQPRPHLTEEQACEVLGVKRLTLWRWNKSGYLKPVKVGKRNLYRQSDIDNLLMNGK